MYVLFDKLIRLRTPVRLIVFVKRIDRNTVKPVLSDHIKQDIFWLFRQVVAYCCMKIVQKAPESS